MVAAWPQARINKEREVALAHLGYRWKPMNDHAREAYEEALTHISAADDYAKLKGVEPQAELRNLLDELIDKITRRGDDQLNPLRLFLLDLKGADRPQAQRNLEQFIQNMDGVLTDLSVTLTDLDSLHEEVDLIKLCINNTIALLATQGTHQETDAIYSAITNILASITDGHLDDIPTHCGGLIEIVSKVTMITDTDIAGILTSRLSCIQQNTTRLIEQRSLIEAQLSAEHIQIAYDQDSLVQIHDLIVHIDQNIAQHRTDIQINSLSAHGDALDDLVKKIHEIRQLEIEREKETDKIKLHENDIDGHETLKRNLESQLETLLVEERALGAQEENMRRRIAVLDFENPLAI